jgi:hypothetical protein
MPTKKPTPKATSKTVTQVINAANITKRPAPKKPMTPADAAYNKLMQKYNYDPTQIPGWNNGRGSQ